LCRSSSCNLNLPLETPNDKEIQPASSTRNKKNKILGAAIHRTVPLAVFLAVILVNMSKREVSDIDYEDTDGSCNEMYDSNSKPVLFFQNSAVKEITVSDLIRSTINFDQANIIGCGGFGLVYKAYLPDGTKAAVKRLSGDSGQMEREFRAEVEALSQLTSPTQKPCNPRESKFCP